MSSAALVAVLAALLGPAAAQSTLYSSGGCRITAFGLESNVTCTCSQTLRQTADSIPIDHLDIIGCLANDVTNQPEVRLAFLAPPGPADALDFVLLKVRSVNISQTRLRLEPVRGRAEALEHPLRRLHIELTELTTGLPDGALQGLLSLERVSLDLVQADRAARSALADLPALRDLVIINSRLQFVISGAVARTPRLRRIRFTNSKFGFISSDAIVVANEDDATLPSDDDDSFLEFSGMVVNTMNTNALRVGFVSRLLASNNSIGVMYSGALNVTLQAPAERRPLFRFTANTVTDMRAEAVAVENAAALPAHLELGGNTLLTAALSPHELHLQGAFERRAVPGLPADRFDCACCECPGTRQLIQVALQSPPTELETAVFVTALARARCANDTRGAFLEFASSCQPGDDLKRRVAALVPMPATDAAWRSTAGPMLMLVLPLVALAAAGRG